MSLLSFGEPIRELINLDGFNADLTEVAKSVG